MSCVSPLPYAVLDHRLRAVWAERREHRATDALAERLIAWVAHLKRIPQSGAFS